MAKKFLSLTGLSHLVEELKKYFVKQVPGKQLSTEDFTNELKTRLEGIKDYELPTASALLKGGIKVGERLTIAEETLSADKAKWEDIQNKPTEFTPAEHDTSKITDFTESVDEEITTKLTEGEYQTKTNVNTILSEGKYQNEDQVKALIAGSSHLTRKVVESIPVDAPDENTVYMVKKTSEDEDQNIYDEYLYIAEGEKYEHIGSSDVDLTNYVKQESLATYATKEELSGYAKTESLGDYAKTADFEEIGTGEIDEMFSPEV